MMANSLRLKIFLVLLYCLTLTPTDPSELAAAPPPPSSSPPLPESVTVPIPNPFEPGSPSNGNQIGQERDLGKAVLGFAIPLAMGVLTVGKKELSQSELSIVLILVSLGFAAILSGIQLKDTFPEFARIVEALGIALVAISFFATVALFLPPETSWVPVVCIGLCLLPFGFAVWRPPRA